MPDESVQMAGMSFQTRSGEQEKFMKSIRELKSLARQAMAGNTGWLILALVAYSILGFGGSMITDVFFPGSDLPALILSQAFYFLLTLVFGIFYAGVRLLYLNAARGREFSLENLVYFFKNNPDHVIVCTFAVALVSLLVSIPINIYTYHLEVGNTIEEQMAWAVQTLMLTAASSLLAELLTIPFEMIYFLLADDPEMTGTQAIKGSVKMLKGKLGKLLLLKISFIPLMFLSAFTLYLALLWVLPYMEMTTVMFYRDLRGELEDRI